MPCNDVTERIRIVLDRNERLKWYSLTKRACGAGIGPGSLLIHDIAGVSVSDLLESSDSDFHEAQAKAGDIGSFLRLKHILALKAALRAYTGVILSDESEFCAIIGVDKSDSETIIDAEIDIPLLTEKIESCDGDCPE